MNEIVKADGLGPQVFDFRGRKVRTAGTWERPLFCAADVCAVLGIENARDAVARLDPEDVELVSVEHASGGKHASFVTESGLYQLILGSRKPQARPFKRWVTGEVLPAIRQRGYYSAFEARVAEEREKLLAEHFSGLPGPSKLLVADLIGAMLRRFGWVPTSGRRVPARGGNPPWGLLLASWLYGWSCGIEGQQEHRRSKNPASRGSDGRLRVSAQKSDQGLLSDVAEASYRQVVQAGIAILAGSVSWEDWRYRMELAFGKKPLQARLMVPMLGPQNHEGKESA